MIPADSVTIRVPTVTPFSKKLTPNESGSTLHELEITEWSPFCEATTAARIAPMAPPSSGSTANTKTITVDCWNDAFSSGNNCDFCSGQITPPPFTYNCNEGTAGGWTPDCAFQSPVLATQVVTKVKAVIVMKDCSGQRGYPSSTFKATLNSVDIAPAHTVSLNNCGCEGQTCLREEFISGDYPGGFPGFVNGGANVLGIVVLSGAICVEKVELTLTFAPNLFIEIDQTFDPSNPVDQSSLFVPGATSSGSSLGLAAMPQIIKVHVRTELRGDATFQLQNVSALPGRAVNYPPGSTDTSVDMHFGAGLQTRAVRIRDGGASTCQ